MKNPHLTKKELREIAKKLKYRFKKSVLIERALRHSSFANEYKGEKLSSYETLEFLGDAVLEFLVTEIAFAAHPDWREGDLSKLRSTLVDEKHLAKIARSCAVGKFIRAGSSEEKTIRKRPSLLADVLEAIVAAIYLDGGMNPARNFVKRHFERSVKSARLGMLDRKNYKSRLQEIMQSLGVGLPSYRLEKTEGPPHKRVFKVSITLGGKRYSGKGFSRQGAEQASAKSALSDIKLWIQRLHG